MQRTNTFRRAMRGALLVFALAFAPACATAQPSLPADAQAVTQTELFLFIYRPGPTWREGAPIARQQGMREHGAYMQQLLSESHLVAGGGFHDTGTEGGMAIVRAASIDEARAILAADPAITTGTFAADLRHWRPRFGGVEAP